MAAFITIATIILFVIIVIWSFHNLEDIEKSRKIIYIIFEILLTGVITFVIFELSKGNISYPSIDIMNTIKNPIVLLFTGINGCLIIPYMSKILAGVRQNSISTEELRKKIVYVSQDEMLYTDTIYNNIVLDHEISYQKYLEIIKLTGVDKLIEKSMLKDDMLLDNNASNFSGGEKQRIILARTLVKNSDIYIFDESFSALDIKSERILLKKIFEYLKNKTILVISHRFNNRDLYQKFILIEKGILYEY